jgi:hypothetical protein
MIGRLTLIWGHVDIQIDNLLRELLRLDPDAFNRRFRAKTISPKLDELAKEATGWPDGERKTKMLAMVAAVADCAVERNLITHGQWGYIWRRDTRIWEVGAWNRTRQTGFAAARLPDLYDRMVAASLACDEIHHLVLLPVEAGPWEARFNKRFIWSDVSPSDPDGPPGPPPEI